MTIIGGATTYVLVDEIKTNSTTGETNFLPNRIKPQLTTSIPIRLSDIDKLQIRTDGSIYSTYGACGSEYIKK